MEVKDLKDKEKTLIEKLRTIPYGQVTVFIQNNQPVRIEQIKESIVL